MKDVKIIVGACLAGALAFSTQSFAETSWYLSGKVGQTSAEADLGFDDLDDSATSYGIAVGVNFNEYFGLQLGYTDYSEFEEAYSYSDPFFSATETYSGEVSALSFSVIGSIPMSDSVSLFGRLGMASWDTDLKEDYIELFAGFDPYAESYGDSDSGTDLVYGFGANWKVTGAFALSFEYETLSYDADFDGFDVDIDLKTASLAAVFSF